MENNIGDEFEHCTWFLDEVTSQTFDSDFYTVDEMKKFINLYRQLRTWQVLTENRIRREHTTPIPNLTDAKSKEDSCYNCIYFNGSSRCKKFPSDLKNTCINKTCPEHQPGQSDEVKDFSKYAEEIGKSVFLSRYIGISDVIKE